MSDQTREDPPVQVIRDDEGNPLFATLAYDEFEALLNSARRASGLQAAADAIRSEMNRLALIPSDIVHRIARGEHPVRVWRLHRGLKAVELAREAGISPGYLSELETGKKDGTFKTMALIAKTLGVKLDDLNPVIDEVQIDEHRREVQLRDIARQISEIDSMINGRGGFDSGAVRAGAQRLINDAKAFMADRGGKFDWLEGVIERAHKIIDEINSTEHSIVRTVTDTQGRLSQIFSDSLSRAGLFPRDMLTERAERAERPEPAPKRNGSGASTPAGNVRLPGTADEPAAAEHDDDFDDSEEEERPRGWFLR